MYWTFANPMEPGYYWVRYLRNAVGPVEESFYPEPQIVHVYDCVGEMLVAYSGGEVPDRLYNLSGEWYGPLEPPI